MGDRNQTIVAEKIGVAQGVLSDWIHKGRTPRNYRPKINDVLGITEEAWSAAIRETRSRKKNKTAEPKEVPRRDRNVSHIAKVLIEGGAQEFTEIDIGCLSDIELRIGKKLSSEVAILILNFLHSPSG